MTIICYNMKYMAIEDDRKGALKKLKLLAYNSKSNVETFRTKINNAFFTPFLPNGVERTEHKYGNVECDILSPEIFSSNRIMIYIHGGCFTGGSRAAYRGFCSSIAYKCYSKVILPEYRLAPAHPYPAAIEDIQSVFRAIFAEGQINNDKIPEIIIAADGSGASIASALIFRLTDKYRACIKQIVFFSPWLNISDSSRIISSKKMSDEIISSDVLRKSSSDYTFASNANIPEVSPVMADDQLLQNFPPVFIQMGAKEILLEDATNFTDRMNSLGNTCQLDVWPNMMHMFQLADEYLHESHLALDKVGKIVTKDDAGSKTIQINNSPKLEQSLKSEA